MRFYLLLLLPFLSLPFLTHAQSSYLVKGSVTDSAENVMLSVATVSVINQQDSILKAFTWTTNSGSFSLEVKTPGRLLLIVSYPNYADYVEAFTLDSGHTSHDFGRLNMVLRSHLLQEVIIKGQLSSIKIKGDTIDFNARAFKVQANDRVEDLLRQLPGIQIDKDGRITAQGETVSKVLLDGEEFFGDDPTLVTQNIRADMVDKVQLYDKKSDQAAFTGINDGIRIKTINIKLKEDKKNGYFGKLDAGKGTGKYYKGQALYNRFTSTQKLSAFATTSNTGKTGLNWEDNNNYGGDGDGLESYNGQYDGKGMPHSLSGGLHYDGKWNNNNQSLNANYKTGIIQVDGTNYTLNQNNLPDSIINTNSSQKFHKYLFRQKVAATYQSKIDTSSDIKMSFDYINSSNKIIDQYLTSSYVNRDTLLNKNRRDVTNNVLQNAFNLNAFYTKKFGKPGRTLSWFLSGDYNQSNANGILNSELKIFKNAGVVSQKINQLKTNFSKNSSFYSNITLTEPIVKKLAIVFNYSFAVSRNWSNQRSFDSTGVNIYAHLDSNFSNHYILTQYTNQVGALFNYSTRSSTLNFGAKMDYQAFSQLDQFYNTGLYRKFMLWRPQANYQLRINSQKVFNLSYSGNTGQPSISQLQPLRNNLDPLNIFIGNPYLKPFFSNVFGLNYNSFQYLHEQHIYLSAGYSFTVNPIVSNAVTDSTGRSTYQSINLPTKKPSNFNATLVYSRRLKPSGIGLGFNAGINGGTNYNLVNDALNKTTTYNYSIQLLLSGYKLKKYELTASFGPNFIINQSSLQPTINNNGKAFNSNASLVYYLPLNFRVTGNGAYQVIGKTRSFNQNLSKVIVDASIIKTLLKNECLKIIISGNDLLNQNVGFSRYTSGNIINQNSYTTIKRYYMLSLVYDFNKMGEQHN